MSLAITPLLNIIEETPVYCRLKEALRGGKTGLSAVVPGAARAFVIASLYRSLQLPVLVVTAQPEEAKKLHEQLLVWCNSNDVRLFPEPDALPYERIASDVSTGLERVQVLSSLVSYSPGALPLSAPLVIVSAPALMGKMPACGEFTSNIHTLEAGIDIEPLQLISRWQAMGYRMENVVEVPGTISRRGGIVDIYPPDRELPARLEFFGNTIESIRLFAPESQRSVGAVSSVTVGPATELLAPLQLPKRKLKDILSGIDLSNCREELRQHFQQEMAMLLEGQTPRHLQFYASLFNGDSVFSYLPPNALIVLDEPQSIARAIAGLEAEAEQLRSEKLELGKLPRNFPRPYLTWKELEPVAASRQQLKLNIWGTDEESYRLDFVSAGSYAGQMPAFVRRARQLLELKERVIIVSNQASRLSELLHDEGIVAAPLTEIKQTPPRGSLTLVHASLPEGWVMDENTSLFTDNEVFGFVKQRRSIKRRAVPRHKLFSDITTGEYVVHVEHGIARFIGVTTLGANGNEKEYLALQYAAGDKLYVPTDLIDRVSRYIGAGDRLPVLSRLGTQEWSRTKQRAKEAAENLAQELLNLYATREVAPGFAYSPDTVWQRELEASFPYVETPDQLQAQEEVKADMEKTRPMDRLVCGDVGYGKTEVAVRAAFKAVMDNRQVAVMVPTTVLAEQHLSTFRQRFDAFPVRVEVLSRFKSPREQRAIIKDLASGSVDICIGTHRLLQKDVVFKDLGLLIIDEEQRFGVAHKEHFKKMRREVDVLTLSATPIPRTLHMSLVGVRDMSTMETPPEDRQPVKTYVAEYNDHLVREAVLRELERNGQVFFVHNRVQSIALVAAKLQSLIPEARIAIAHGQMPEEELEGVMTDFTRGKTDILLCTTIIESGLDMPNVNTVIVNQADKFGLTQLYQLRGRVGRGANLAYAYLLFDGGKRITPTAEKRLRTIYEAAELGAGFNIAMKDLEIRGAGTLLGARQSGYISAIGFSLYCRLLAEAVEEQKAGLAGARETVRVRPPAPTIDLPLNAYLPEGYVSDVNTRIELYQDMVKLEAIEQVDAEARELSDRFGALPAEVKNLLYAVKIRLMAAEAGVESIFTEDGQIIIRLLDGRQFDRQKLVSRVKDGIKIGTRQLSLNYKKMGKGWQKVLEETVENLF